MIIYLIGMGKLPLLIEWSGSIKDAINFVAQYIENEGYDQGWVVNGDKVVDYYDWNIFDDAYHGLTHYEYVYA